MKAARLVVLTKRRNEFTVQEIVLRLREDYPEFSERAIGEAIATNSRQVAPVRNGDSQVVFERIGPTGYRLVTRFGLARQVKQNSVRFLVVQICKPDQKYEEFCAATGFEGNSRMVFDS
jgi:hypothetical protein